MHRIGKLFGAVALVFSVTGSAHAVIIDFDALPVGANTAFFGTFMEDGFTLDFDDYFYGSGSTSTPDFEVERLAVTDGILTVTATGGGLFTFQSVDWQLEYGEVPEISLEGFLGAASVGIDTFDTVSSDYATFFASVLSGVAIDRLVIRADRDADNGGAFDTLVLETADAPEPTTLALFSLCLVALGYSRKRTS